MELVSKNIKDYLSNDKYQFEVFNILYTEEEKECIRNFNVNKTITYDSYSNFYELENFIRDIGDNSPEQIKIMISIIKKLTEVVIEGYSYYDMNHFWLTIRVTQPTDKFDITRWHCDGRYFPGDTFCSKFATIFQGNSTLLLKTDEKQREQFIELRDILSKSYGGEMDLEYRKNMNRCIEGDTVVPNNEQAVIFKSGDRYKCGIHSEPKKDTNRIFFSIVPGKKEDIDHWQKKTQSKKIVGGNTEIYFSKYLKYKNKYLQIKN